MRKTIASRDAHIQSLEKQCESMKQQLASSAQLSEQLARSEGQVADLEARLMQCDAEASREIQKHKDVIAELTKSVDRAVKKYEAKTDECNSIIENSVGKPLYYEVVQKNKALKDELQEAKKDIDIAVG